MRLGDTGLIVDYIVSKLLDYYPEMDSGEVIGWSSVNSKYLRRYLIEHMPEMLQMMNISSNNVLVKTLYSVITDESVSLSNIDSMTTDPDGLLNTKDRLVQTNGVVIDTHRGTPYSENPLKLISIPVQSNKSYNLVINYSSVLSEPINYADPDNDWSLSKYSVLGITRGDKLVEGSVLINNKMLINTPTTVTKRYITLPTNSYSILFNQVIQWNPLNDKLHITGSGKTYFIDGSSKTISGAYVSVDYDNVSETITLHDPNGGQIGNPLTKNSKITLGTAGLTLIRSGATMDLLTLQPAGDIITDKSALVIQIVDQISNGMVLNTTMNVTYPAKLVINKPPTGKELTYGGATYLVNSSNNIVKSDDILTVVSTPQIPSGSSFMLDGITYIAESNIPSKSGANGGTEKSVEDNESTHIVRMVVDIPEIPISDIPTVATGVISAVVNDDPVGYNLVIQVPESTVNFSILEIPDDSENIKVDPSEFTDGLMVTSKYLDVILLDRTITKYSRSDDIEYLQDLFPNEQFPHKGVYNDKLRDEVKKIQSMPASEDPLHPTGMGRTYYITGWSDPETEIFLELLNGY